jgi:minor extracellular serine protease Vpr
MTTKLTRRAEVRRRSFSVSFDPGVQVSLKNWLRLASLAAVAAIAGGVGGAGVDSARAQAAIDVIVQVDGTPAGIARARASRRGAAFDAGAYVQSLRESQDRVLDRVRAAGIDASVLTTTVQRAVDTAAEALQTRYYWSVNGLALRVPAGTLAAIDAVPGVRHVEPVREVRALLDTSVPYTGATQVWEQYGFRGENMTVADIDTGIEWDHPAFTTNPALPPGPAHPKVKKYMVFSGASPADGYGHGTHVGGIIAADTSLGHPVTQPETGYGPSLLNGVAPKSFLYGYKVLSDAGSGLNASVVLGIDQAVADNAHILNLSLGSNNDDPESAESVALANAMAAGHFVAVAAGNAGPGYSTIGTPATRQEPLTVGSSTDPGNNQYYVNDRADTRRLAINLMANSPTPPTTNPIEALYVHVGLGCSPADYATKASVIGRIALIQRGVCTFTAKKELAQVSGAVAAIIYNNVAGNFSGTMTRSRIVVAALSDVDGQHLVTHTNSTSGLSSHTLQFDPSFDTRVGQISGFSSRGPTDDYRIKPDIVAPGDSVTSSVPQVASTLFDPSGYAEAGGTSMATPHMAGAAALMRQAHPDWSTREMKAAFMNTAARLIEPTDNKPYSIMDQGAGVVRVKAALDTPAVILSPSHSFQVVHTGGATRTVSHDFAIVDKSGSARTWSLSWENGDGKNRNTQGRALPAAGWSQSISPSSVSVPANGTAGFTLAVTLDGSVLAEGDYEGWIVATNGATTLRVPVFARHQRTPIEGAEAPTLQDPGETNTTGSYQLSWSNVAGEAGYRVQQSTNYGSRFSDDAEAGMSGKWRTTDAPNQWSTSNLQAHGGSQSYWSGQNDERTAILTLANAVSVPEGSEVSFTFWSWEDTEPDFDFGYVDVSNDGGTSWFTALEINGFSDGWVQRQVNLDISGQLLFRFRYETDLLISAPFHLGWFVDDIAISVGSWSTIGNTSTDVTTHQVTGQASGTYFHRVAGLYARGGSQPATGPWSNVVDILVEQATAPAPDLQVTNLVANQQKGREGEKVQVVATVTNAGNGPAAASRTQFMLDGTTSLGVVDTPALGAGQSAEVSVLWDTRSVQGEHELRATADSGGTVAESDENNNSATRTVTVKGNKVQNGSFEQQSASGGPAAWTGSSTDAGTASSSQDGGTDGSAAVTISGNGGNAATAGSPAWTSDAFTVTGGETLDLVVSARTTGLSSAPTAGLVLLGPVGEVVDTLRLITAPLLTDGFSQLEQQVTIPLGVAQARVVLFGFAPTDTTTAGTVTFDDVGLFAR